MNKIFTIIIFLSCSLYTNAQENDAPETNVDSIRRAASNNGTSLPEINTISPKATQMERFGIYPTNLYTGQIDITIPIHKITVGTVTVPVEFKYNTSGLKYDDMPLELGYGWTLMAGGTARYTARGMGEDHPSRMITKHFIKEVKDIKKFGDIRNDKWEILVPEDQRRLAEVVSGYDNSYLSHSNYICDSEYDQYVFSVPGINGSLYKLIKQFGDYDTFSNDNSTNLLDFGSEAGNGAELISTYPVAKDAEGNIYRFGISDYYDDNRNITYYLTSITERRTGEHITFIYESHGTWGYNDTSRPFIAGCFTVMEKTYNPGGIPQYETRHDGGMSLKYFYVPKLLKIQSRNSTVKFVYGSTKDHAITEIQIWNGDETQIIRKIYLDKANDEYLNAVRFCDSYGQEVYSYKMEYNGKKPNFLAQGVDYWGYNTSLNGNIMYLPDFDIPHTSNLVKGSRQANEALMKAGILTKLTYPTKGYTCFEYEAHRVRNNSQYTTNVYGGLRIAMTVNYDSNGNILESKYYEYGENRDGLGRAVCRVAPEDFRLSTGFLNFQRIEGMLFMTDKTIYNSYYTFPRINYFINGSSVVYPEVTEISKSPQGTTLGRTLYKYSDFDNPSYYNYSSKGYKPDIPCYSDDWKCGRLTEKSIYDATDKLVHRIMYIYKENNVKQHLNLRVRRFWNRINEEYLQMANFLQFTGGTEYDYYHYYTPSGDYVVDTSTETLENGTSITRKYEYNEKSQVRKITENLSDGTTRTINISHPFDLTENSDAASINIYEPMTSYKYNRLAPIIRQTTSIDGIVVDDIYNEYTSATSELVATWQKIPSETKRLEYTYDSKGNLSSAVKDGTEAEVCIWGYKGEWPVAVIKGSNAKNALTILGSSTISSILSSYSEYGMSQIESLRTNSQMANCQITTYYYDTRYGLTKQINPNGTKQSYNYDSFGRLTSITNDEGYVLEKYEYDYKK